MIYNGPIFDNPRIDLFWWALVVLWLTAIVGYVAISYMIYMSISMSPYHPLANATPSEILFPMVIHDFPLSILPLTVMAGGSMGITILGPAVYRSLPSVYLLTDDEQEREVLRRARFRVMTVILLIGHCLFWLTMVYLFLEVEIFMNFLSVLHEAIVAIIAIAGIVAVMISTFYRFSQVKKYGIPFRVTANSFWDLADVFIICVMLLGLNIALPLWAAFSDISHAASLGVIATSLFIGGAFLFWTFFSSAKLLDAFEKEGIGRRLSIFWGILLILAAGCSFVLAVLNMDIYYSVAVSPYGLFDYETGRVNLTQMQLVFFFGYATLILIACVKTVANRNIHQNQTLGAYKTPMTIVHNNKLYIVVSRYSKSEWILVPCHWPKKDAAAGSKSEGRGNSKDRDDGVLRFKYGEFMLLDIKGKQIVQKEYREVMRAK